jgi:hypothetical protein
MKRWVILLLVVGLVAGMAVPALAAGNCVVLKPATLAPLTALKLGELAAAAGLRGARADASGKTPGAAGLAAATTAQATPCAAKAAANPCGAAPAVQLTPVQARRAYECLLPEMLAASAESGDPVAKAYAEWPRFSAQRCQSASHGQRYVQNDADPKNAQRYGRFEKAGRFPPGAVTAEDSFVAHPDGGLEVGPLFIMEKLPAGPSPTTFDWAYGMINPDGSVAEDTNVPSFCAGCHGLSADSRDSLYFVPPDFRRRR